MAQKVKAGEKIGLVGNTGKSTATHLYFEGVAIDPLDLSIKKNEVFFTIFALTDLPFKKSQNHSNLILSKLI